MNLTFRIVIALILALVTAPRVLAAPPRPRLILVIVADTLRADHLKAYGYSRDTMPKLERLMASGTIFTQSYSAAGHTQPSVSSILTGLRPAVHGYYNFHEPKQRPLDLPTWLRARGYFAASVNANPNTPWFYRSYDYAWADQPPDGYFTAERTVAENHPADLALRQSTSPDGEAQGKRIKPRDDLGKAAMNEAAANRADDER